MQKSPHCQYLTEVTSYIIVKNSLSHIWIWISKTKVHLLEKNSLEKFLWVWNSTQLNVTAMIIYCCVPKHPLNKRITYYYFLQFLGLTGLTWSGPSLDFLCGCSWLNFDLCWSKVLPGCKSKVAHSHGWQLMQAIGKEVSGDCLPGHSLWLR